MRGLSPITIGMGVLTALILGVSVYFLSSRTLSHSAAPSIVPEEQIGKVVARGAGPLLSLPFVEPAVSPPLRSRQPIDVTAEAGRPGSVTTLIRPDFLPRTSLPLRHRSPVLYQAWRRHRLTLQADEAAFEALKTNDETRAAIRAINAKYAPPRPRFGAGAADGPPDVTEAAVARLNTDRRGAIEAVLGVGAATALYAAEAAARVERENALKQQALIAQSLEEASTAAETPVEADGGSPPLPVAAAPSEIPASSPTSLSVAPPTAADNGQSQ